MSIDAPTPLRLKNLGQTSGAAEYMFGESPSTGPDKTLGSPDPIVVFVDVYAARVPADELPKAMEFFKRQVEEDLPPDVTRLGEVDTREIAGRATIVERVRFKNGSERHRWFLVEDGTPIRVNAYVFPATPADWRDAPRRMIESVRRNKPALPGASPAMSGQRPTETDDSVLRSIVESVLKSRGEEYRIDGDAVRVEKRTGAKTTSIATIRAVCGDRPREDWPNLILAYLAGFLMSEPVPLGKLEDVLKAKPPPDYPFWPLLAYHELREAEKQAWERSPPEAAVRRANPRAVPELAALVSNAIAYASSEQGRFVDVDADEADTAALRLVGRYRSGSDDERRLVRSRVDRATGWNLLTFAERAAVRGLRARAEGPILDALTALAIEDLAQGDVRDDLVALGLVFHCARSAGVDPDGLFARAAGISGPPMARVLADFLKRRDLDRIAPLMGWREETGPRGIGFVLPRGQR